MIYIDTQYFGGNGASSGKKSGGAGGSKATQSVEERVINSKRYIGQSAVESQIEDELNHNLGAGEEYAQVDSFKIVSNPGDGDFGDVEAEYHVNTRTPIGRDPETGDMEYEYDTEYRKDTFQVKLKK